MSFKVRKAVASDVADMAYAKSNAFKEAYSEFFPKDFIEQSINLEEMYYSCQKSIFGEEATPYVVIYNNVMVGMFFIKCVADSDFSENVCELSEMYFLPDYWNKGYGKRTFRDIRKAVKNSKTDTLIVWVPKINTRAKYFFEVCGFSPDGKTRTVNGNGGFSYEEIRMVRKEELKQKD